MDSIIEVLKARLREVGPPGWQVIADKLNAGLPADDERRVSVHFMRKVAYGDRDNPRLSTVQPLLDHFGLRLTDEARAG